MELAFDVVRPPQVTQLAPFRFAHVRVKGPYQPWARVQALDTVAEMLEGSEVTRTGPAFGIYHDLPMSEEEPDDWRADLGYPIAVDARVTPRPGLRVRDVPALDAAGLTYRGDLTSFPDAFQLLLDWVAQRDVHVAGCLMERFHVSDALTGLEERDVYVALHPFPL